MNFDPLNIDRREIQKSAQATVLTDFTRIDVEGTKIDFFEF